jgi:hypothetical protein
MVGPDLFDRPPDARGFVGLRVVPEHHVARAPWGKRTCSAETRNTSAWRSYQDLAYQLAANPNGLEGLIKLSEQQRAHRLRVWIRRLVERLIASLPCNGARRLTDKGHRGTIVQTRTAVMAHNAATLVRIHEYRLSKRVRTFCRRLGLRCRKVNQCNASIS